MLESPPDDPGLDGRSVIADLSGIGENLCFRSGFSIAHMFAARMLRQLEDC